MSTNNGGVQSNERKNACNNKARWGKTRTACQGERRKAECINLMKIITIPQFNSTCLQRIVTNLLLNSL